MRKAVLALPVFFLGYAAPLKITKPGYTVYAYGNELFYDIYSNGTLNTYCKHDGKRYDCSLLKGVDGLQDIKSMDITKEIYPNCSSRRWFMRRFERVRRKMAGKKKA